MRRDPIPYMRASSLHCEKDEVHTGNMVPCRDSDADGANKALVRTSAQSASEPRVALRPHLDPLTASDSGLLNRQWTLSIDKWVTRRLDFINF